MNVLHVMPFPGIGGTEIATRRIAEAVRPFGVRSAALLLRPSDDQRAYFEAAGIPCLRDVPRPEPSLLRDGARFLKDFPGRRGRLPGLRCGALRRRVGRLLFRSGRSDGPAARALSRSQPRQPHAVAEPGLRRRSEPLHLRLPQYARPFCDAHQAIPHQRSLRWVDIPPRPDPARQAAAAAAIRAEFGLPEGTWIAAMFARVNPQKDYVTLIKAAARLKDAQPWIRFLVVGDNAQVPTNREHFRQVQETARAAGVLDRFIFTGFRADIDQLMLSADACVLCTHFEGLPLVLIEAMALGRPCIATSVDGIPEALTEGVTGLLHAHGDAEALAAGIARLANGGAEVAAMAARAREEAERRFGRVRFAHDLQALYRSFGRASGAGIHNHAETDAALS